MWFDLVIVALLVFSAARGAAKGFAWQVATIGSLVLCFMFAESGSLAIAPLIKVDPPLNRWIAMLILYLGASFVAFAAARAVRKTLESWQFAEYDRHLGAVFGLLKGVGFALVLVFFVLTLAPSLRDTVLNSYTGRYAGQILATLHPVMPDELHGVIDPYLAELGQPVVHNGDFGHDGEFGQAPTGQAGPEFGQYPGGDPLSHNDGGFGPAPEFGFDPRFGGSAGGSPDSAFGTPAGYSAPANTRQAGYLTPPGDTQPRGTSPRGTATPAVGDDLRRLVGALPGLNQDVRQLALTALQNTKPEDRSELVRQFQTAIPGLVKATATEWQRGKPAAADRLSQRDQTLREIAGIYTENLDGQRWIIREAEQRLRGVPDDVALVAVQDWYADLLNLTPDPDPGTNLSTRIEIRITRQLRSFGVPLDALGADTRARLVAPATR